MEKQSASTVPFVWHRNSASLLFSETCVILEIVPAKVRTLPPWLISIIDKVWCARGSTYEEAVASCILLFCAAEKPEK